MYAIMYTTLGIDILHISRVGVGSQSKSQKATILASQSATFNIYNIIDKSMMCYNNYVIINYENYIPYKILDRAIYDIEWME